MFINPTSQEISAVTDLKKVDTSKTENTDYDASIFNYGCIVNIPDIFNFHSILGPYAFGIGALVDIFDGDTKDKKITSTEQGSTGDCWVLAGVNALNETEKGKEILGDTLNYVDFGTFVNLKGLGKIFVFDYEVTSTKGTPKYSSGDDDMIILELTVEKVREKIANGEIIDKTRDDYNIFGFEDDYSLSSVDRGNHSELFELITGKQTEEAITYKDKSRLLDKFIQNENKDYALGCGMNETQVVEDCNGKKVKLQDCHAYSVKYANDEEVCVINPWNSSEEIHLPKETFLEYFSQLHGVDLSDDNPESERYIMLTREKVTEDGGTVEYYKDKNGTTLKEIHYFENGNPKNAYRYNENGNILAYEEYSDDKKLNSKTTYIYDYNSKKLLSKTENVFNKEGEISYACMLCYHENGKINNKDETIYPDNPNDNVYKISEIYDESGNLIYYSSTMYKNDKPALQEMTYNDRKIRNTFDEKGKIIKTEIDNDMDGEYDEVEYS